MSFCVCGKISEIADARTRARPPSQRLRHQRGSFTKPNAASTAIAPSAQVNQCDAAASGTGTPIPFQTQIA